MANFPFNDDGTLASTIGEHGARVPTQAALDGLEALLAPGGGLPSQWAIDDKGNLRIEPDASGSDVDASLIVKGNGRSDTFMIERQLTTERTLGIDEDGYIVTSGGADIGDTSSIGTFGTVVNIGGGAANTAPNGSYLRVREGGGGLIFFRVKGDGNVLMPNLPTADPHIAGALWNDAGTVKVSAG
jgi:hypothetical protein